MKYQQTMLENMDRLLERRMVKEEKDVLAKEKIEETVEETTKRETAKVTKEKVEKEIPTLENKQEKSNPKRNKKPFTIAGFTIVRLLAYFIIYSVIGFIIETLFGLLTKGVLESRKSFMYEPFCGIYGLGAVVMIIGLQRLKKNNYTLFFGGFLIGSIVEYVISWIGEMIFQIKWWDYSNVPFNLNGRICVWFSLFWGILAIYLMSHLHPKVDRLLDKFSIKTLKIIVTIFDIRLYSNRFCTKNVFHKVSE